LSTCDTQFPTILWSKLVGQAQDTLNMLRTSRCNPRLSAFQVLNGTHDYNRVPFAPPGTRATIFNPPEMRASWGSRALDAWYVGPAWKHYRCAEFQVPSTGGYRISGQANFYPQHCKAPVEHPLDEAKRTALDLLQAVRKLCGQEVGQPSRHATALKQLAEIFQEKTGHLQDDRGPRAPQTSSNPTEPAQLRSTPRVHSRVTRNNTPGILPTPPPLTSKEVPPAGSEGGPANSEGEPADSEGGPAVSEGGEKERGGMSRRGQRQREKWRARRRSPRLNPNLPGEEEERESQKGEDSATPEAELPHKRAAVEREVLADNSFVPIEPTIPAPRYTPAPSFRTPRFITQEAFQAFALQAASQPAFNATAPGRDRPPDIQHFCAPVVHPVTGELITKYAKLAADPILKETWTTAFGKEFGSQAQGDNKTGKKGSDTLFVLDHEQIKAIPKDRTITYARLVVDYRPQKEDPNRVRITAGGNLIDYPGDVTTRTADLVTSKILWNSVLSTEGAKYMTMDISNFYLSAPLDRYEYMRFPFEIFPQHVVEQYDLKRKQKNGFVYVEIRKAIYGLPQAGALANKLLKERLAPHGYYEVPHTPGLWKHVSRPIQFTLVVDDFGVKYVGREHAEHLLGCIQKDYPVTVDWAGDLYCGIKLEWNYKERWLDISMPGYIKKVLQRYAHPTPKKPQHSPFPVAPKKFGKAAQETEPDDAAPPATDKEKTEIQRVVGSILYYGRAVDITTLTALGTLGARQSKATKTTVAEMRHLLDYLATHPDAIIKYYASDMVLNIHSDASYLSERGARSRASGHYFLGSIPQDGQPIKLNGAIFELCKLLPFVATSAAEAELGALFMNSQEGRIIRLTLAELGHPQPPTPIHCDNATATGIAMDTVKKQRSRSMEMRYFAITDRVKQKEFDVRWHPGLENLGDYLSKHHDAPHHIKVRPIYLHTPESPRILIRAQRPSILRGCVGKSGGGYVRGRPLPTISPRNRMLVPPVA